MQASDAIQAVSLQLMSVVIPDGHVAPDYDGTVLQAMLRVLHTGLTITPAGVLSLVQPLSAPIHPFGASTQGSVPFINASSALAEDNANLFWDATAHVLSVHGGRIDFNGSLDNIALGPNAMTSITTGDFNTALGSQALQNTTIGRYNLAIGGAVLTSNDGDFNVGIGTTALQHNTSGYENAGIGYAALLQNVDGYRNIAVGVQALRDNTDGYYNVGIGASALLANTHGHYNVGIGGAALSANLTGNTNTAIGGLVLSTSTADDNNVAIGFQCLATLAGGTDNTAVGTQAMRLHSAGNFNVAVGTFTLFTSTGSGNVGIGYDTFDTAGITGDYNIGIGYNVGANLTSGARNILIGKQVQTAAASTSDALNIGNLILGDMSGNTVHFHSAALAGSTIAFTDGQALQVGTLTNAPAAGNPTKWIPIDDNGTVRYIPAW